MSEKSPYIFIIEDEIAIAKLISMYLNKADISTKEFTNAEEALTDLKEGQKPDLIILDLNLPGMSGFDFLKTINESIKNAPSVIILSARDGDDDIIKGLGFGADEFITKPFSPSVLVARVQANLRRLSTATSNSEETINFSDYTLYLNSCVLKKGDKKVQLSNKEYQVLEFLVKNAGQVISPEKIYKEIWKVDYGDTTAVAVYIQRLRKKFGDKNENCNFIKTDFGKGYIFNKDLIK